MGRLRHGTNLALEEAAWALISESLKGVTSQEEKKDILTPWKEKDRLSKEVYNSNGVPDGALRRGMYHRTYNSASPHLNSMDVPGRRIRRIAPTEED